LSTGCRFGKLNPGVSVVQPALDYRIRVIVIEELIKRAKVDQSTRDAVSSGSPLPHETSLEMRQVFMAAPDDE
jgi:hypothetical protein